MSVTSTVHGAAASVERGGVSEPCVVSDSERLWFLGTLAQMKLDGHQTGGRFALWEGVLPHRAAPPLHSHPQDEMFYLLEGEVTAWLVEPELAEDQASPPEWVKTRGRRGSTGTTVFAPAGAPHTFRVESDTARMLFLSTPAGIENYVRALANPQSGRGFSRPPTNLGCHPSESPRSSASWGWSATGRHRRRADPCAAGHPRKSAALCIARGRAR